MDTTRRADFADMIYGTTMNKSLVIALLAVVALVLWMLSGQFGSDSAVGEPESANVQETRSTEVVAMKVQTRRQTTGSIESVSVTKGQRVTKDDIIATITADNRKAMLTVARASLTQAKNEYDGARKLANQGLQSKFNLESAAAKLESARAQVSAAQLELDNIVIRAPLAGIIDELPIETGDFVDRGNHIATLIDNSQLLITGQVPQQNISDVEMGKCWCLLRQKKLAQASAPRFAFQLRKYVHI